MKRTPGLALSIALALGAGLGACAQGKAVLDDGPIDSVTGTDADTPTADSGSRRDSATPPADGATPPTDGATPPTDGATPPADARPPDAAPPVDAAPDSTPPVDAGPPDTGAPDTGTDAGGCVTAPPSNACGVVPQCGCSASQTCDVTNVTTGAVACVNSGTAAEGRACSTTSQCARGLTCWNGACHAFCARGTPNCGPGTLCFAPTQASGATTPNLDVCSVACDVSRPSTLCGTNACVWFASNGVADCRPAGTRPEYATCASTADCRQGLVCVNDPIFGPECDRWCRLGSNADCSLGDTCTDVLGASAPTVPGGGPRIGVCVF